MIFMELVLHDQTVISWDFLSLNTAEQYFDTWLSDLTNPRGFPEFWQGLRAYRRKKQLPDIKLNRNGSVIKLEHAQESLDDSLYIILQHNLGNRKEECLVEDVAVVVRDFEHKVASVCSESLPDRRNSTWICQIRWPHVKILVNSVQWKKSLRIWPSGRGERAPWKSLKMHHFVEKNLLKLTPQLSEPTLY